MHSFAYDAEKFEGMEEIVENTESLAPHPSKNLADGVRRVWSQRTAHQLLEVQMHPWVYQVLGCCTLQ